MFSRFINLFFIVFWNKEEDLKTLVLSMGLFQRPGQCDNVANLVILSYFVHTILCKIIMCFKSKLFQKASGIHQSHNSSHHYYDFQNWVIETLVEG